MSFCVVCGLRRFQATSVKLSVGFHLFPTEPVQRQAWEEFCRSGNDETDEIEPDLPGSGHRAICSDHFEEECFRGGGKRLAESGKRHVLKEGVIPTLREGTSLKKWLKKMEKRQKRNKKVPEIESEVQLKPIYEPVIKPEKICRICALEDDTLVDLSLGQNAEYVHRFSSLTSIEIDATAPWLCGGCLGQLNDAFEFVQACTEAENRRKSLFVETLQIKQEEEQEVRDVMMDEFTDDPAKQTTEENEEDKEDDSEDDYSSEEAPKEPKVYTCETCQATFGKSTELYAHVKTHGKSRFPCKLCDRSFARRFFLQEHMFSHKSEPSFFCQDCSASFKYVGSLRRHRKTAHLELKPFSCEECGKRFAQKTHLQAHANVHMEEPTIPCSLCKMMFKTNYRLQGHVSTVHKDDQSLQSFDCEVCSKQFPTRHGLAKHMKNHGEPTMLCTICGKTFKTKAVLTQHMESHNPKTISCELCPKKFNTKYLLYYHQRTHTDDKPFQCQQCSISFKTSKSLKYHQLVHAGLKPFQCDQCERTFRCAAHLKTHQSVHTGDKPHECPVCLRRFAIKANMKLHMKTHAGEGILLEGTRDGHDGGPSEEDDGIIKRY